MEYNKDGMTMPLPTQAMWNTAHPKHRKYRRLFEDEFDKIFCDFGEHTTKEVLSAIKKERGYAPCEETVKDQLLALAYHDCKLVCRMINNSFVDADSLEHGKKYTFRRLKVGEEWWSEPYKFYDESRTVQRDVPTTSIHTHKPSQQTVIEMEVENDQTPIQVPTPEPNDWADVVMKVPKEMYDIANGNAEMDGTDIGQFFFEHLDKDSIMASTIPSYVKRAMERGLNRLQAYIAYETHLEEIKKLKATTEE